MTEPPHDLIITLLSQVVSAQEQNKVVGNFETLDVKPHPASRNIGDETVARQPTVSELNFCQAVDKSPPGFATVDKIS